MTKPLPNSDLDNALRVIRVRKGYTQRTAAEMAGMSRSLWSALERKQRPLTVALLSKIQVAWDLTDEEALYVSRWWGDSRCSIDAA